MSYHPVGADCARTAPSVDGKFMECIDAEGNVLTQTPITPGMDWMPILVGGGAIALLLMWSNKKKGRR